MSMPILFIFLERFLRWLKVFGTSLRERKPNFQGPSLVVFIIDMKWIEYVGNISGFTATISSQADKVCLISYLLILFRIIYKSIQPHERLSRRMVSRSPP